MSQEQNNRLGILLMVSACFVFAIQDGISRHLAAEYNVFMVVMIRYWFFAAFVMTVTARQEGSLRASARTAQPLLQVTRGLLLTAEILIMITAYVHLGLVESLAIFAGYPLIVAALSGPVLGEKVGWPRWAAIGIGFVGILVILKPGFGVFSPAAILALISTALFAIYSVLTRLAARKDKALTSFFWTGTVGAVVMTAIGVFHWEPMIAPDWGWMAALCVTGALGHYLLIRCYEVAEASAVQPFTYLHLAFGATLGVVVFGEALRNNVLVGTLIVVSAGIFTLLRERRKR
ncbi:DMT family transporter [Aliiruegeria lutimaris]|uniref:Permease of the drug/metabolite transporter (DMT) superfamily n=1 Tax=Aliiruegeria lutimaris TaxID=571298 RepID=A0A1G9CST7_9RHOB|nr:DMT family transporter [Aliiruegeria lutimaris]SDK54708.1 Permease of the drug/metabolite transporter (DMT) superfamily [Aliiruegeria lutimaris]